MPLTSPKNTNNHFSIPEGHDALSFTPKEVKPNLPPAASQDWPMGDRLPSTRELAEQLGLSRNTVRAAYELLGVDGLIVARRGAGSFATTPTAPPDKEVRATC